MSASAAAGVMPGTATSCSFVAVLGSSIVPAAAVAPAAPSVVAAGVESIAAGVVAGRFGADVADAAAPAAVSVRAASSDLVEHAAATRINAAPAARRAMAE